MVADYIQESILCQFMNNLCPGITSYFKVKSMRFQEVETNAFETKPYYCPVKWDEGSEGGPNSDLFCTSQVFEGAQKS